MTCPQCNGEVQFDNTRAHMFCSFCGTKLIWEPSQNNSGNGDRPDYLAQARELVAAEKWGMAKTVIDKLLGIDPANAEALYIKQQLTEKIEGKAYLHFRWGEPNIKRDPDNICFAKKFLLYLS